MKKVLVLCTLALLAGCTAEPAPVVRTSRLSFGAGDSLGKDLHRTDSAIADANAKERAFAAHPE